MSRVNKALVISKALSFSALSHFHLFVFLKAFTTKLFLLTEMLLLL